MAHAIDLEPSEKIIKEVRRHMLVFYLSIFFIFVVLLIPLALAVPIDAFLDKLFDGRGATVFGALYMLWMAGLWTIFFMKWTDYYLDVWVVTDKRVFDIEQHGMFHRDISVFQLEQIQDITIEIRGILATFLKFGDVHIHTAGEKTDFIIKDADKPMEVKQCITEAAANAKSKQ